MGVAPDRCVAELHQQLMQWAQAIEVLCVGVWRGCVWVPGSNQDNRRSLFLLQRKTDLDFLARRWAPLGSLFDVVYLKKEVDALSADSSHTTCQQPVGAGCVACACVPPCGHE